jgi:hypothetical protein
MKKVTIFLTNLKYVEWNVKLNSREKTINAGEKFEDFETHFRIKFHEA